LKLFQSNAVSEARAFEKLK